MEHDLNFHAGELVAKAEVRATLAERHVINTSTSDIEAVGIFKHAGIAVTRREPRDDLVTLLDRLAIHLNIARCRATEVIHR